MSLVGESVVLVLDYWVDSPSYSGNLGVQKFSESRITRI